MMRREKFAIANIYVPVKRRATLKPETVQEIAHSILEVGQQAPILVRRDGNRLVLVHGLHRLEACKAWAKKQSMDISYRPRNINRASSSVTAPMKGQGSTYDFVGGAAPVSHVEAGLALLADTMTDPLQSPAPQVVPAVALASVPTPH